MMFNVYCFVKGNYDKNKVIIGWKGEMHLILFPFISFVDLRKVETMNMLEVNNFS